MTLYVQPPRPYIQAPRGRALGSSKLLLKYVLNISQISLKYFSEISQIFLKNLSNISQKSPYIRAPRGPPNCSSNIS